MAKVILILALIPGLLGFLVSQTITMHGDMEQLKVENQRLSNELSQLRSHYETIAQEHDAVLAENESLKYQFNAIQNAYLTENQARLKAESDLEVYKGMVLNMTNNIQNVSPSACTPVEQHAMKPEELLLSTIAPVGASPFITLAVVGLVVTIINYFRKQKRLRNMPAQIKNLR